VEKEKAGLDCKGEARGLGWEVGVRGVMTWRRRSRMGEMPAVMVASTTFLRSSLNAGRQLRPPCHREEDAGLTSEAEEREGGDQKAGGPRRGREEGEERGEGGPVEG
jgi:hypothetical protein